MKRITIALIVLLMCIFVSCSDQISITALKACGSFGVPGMMYRDLKGGTTSCNILEEDEYGRILYEYTAFNEITDRRDTALVISQRFEEDCVYFYEDLCYDLSENAHQNIDALKAANDWGKPLDNKKMSRRTYGVSFDSYIMLEIVLSYERVRSACSKKLDISSSYFYSFGILDEDQSGCEMYLLETTYRKRFLVLVNEEYEVVALPIEYEQISSDVLADLKHEIGWHYGYRIE